MTVSAGQILAIGAVGIAGVVVFRASKKAGDVADALDPTNNKNVISKGFNELVEAVGIRPKDGSDFSLGSFLFDVFNPEFDPNAPVEKTLEKSVFFAPEKTVSVAS